MSWTFGQVKARVRNLLDDPQGSYLTDDFIGPLVNEAYEDMNSQLMATQSSYDIGVIELPAIPAGTANLTDQQTGTGPLERMAAMPERIDWKPAGTDPSYYQLVENFAILPDSSPEEGVAGWEFRSGIIWLTPSSIPVDLRVRGEFLAQQLREDTDVLATHPRIGYVVAYATAALIAAVRGNTPWAQAYESKAAEGMDEIMGQLVRAEQGQVRRISRQSRRRSSPLL